MARAATLSAHLVLCGHELAGRSDGLMRLGGQSWCLEARRSTPGRGLLCVAMARMTRDAGASAVFQAPILCMARGTGATAAAGSGLLHRTALSSLTDAHGARFRTAPFTPCKISGQCGGGQIR